jgi:YceI-like domain
MKRALSIIGVIGVTVLITYLAITRYLSQERAARLDRALMDAEARVIQLEADIEAAKQRPAGLTQGNGVPPTAGRSAITSPALAGAAEPLVRYVATSKPGLTNLVRIEGTSTVHDWQVESHLIGGSAELGTGLPTQPGAQSLPGTVDAKVNVFIPVRSLKSVEKNGSPYSDPMDEIMYGKLLDQTNKRITYTLTSLILKEQPRQMAFLYEATGNLCVAGVTNVITMPVTALPDAAGRIQFAGSVKVKMTDFKISPPSPSLGGVSIKTGDEVTLRFVWWVNRVSPEQSAK